MCSSSPPESAGWARALLFRDDWRALAALEPTCARAHSPFIVPLCSVVVAADLTTGGVAICDVVIRGAIPLGVLRRKTRKSKAAAVNGLASQHVARAPTNTNNFALPGGIATVSERLCYLKDGEWFNLVRLFTYRLLEKSAISRYLVLVRISPAQVI